MTNLSSTYCPLPFTHLHVTATGDVKPCCVSKPFASKVDVNNQSLDEIYNNKHFKEIRRSLLTNKRPNECAVCWEQEASNLVSHRMKFLEEVPTPPRTEIVPVEFDYIDIRFSNVCNLKCIMCSGENSHLLNNGKVLQVADMFVEELKPKLHNTRRVYFAGGEPLIMDQHYDVLHYLSIHNPDVVITYNTNLQVLEKGKYKVIDLWSKFKHKPFVLVSVDGLYEIGEKIRSNFNTEKFINNVHTLMEHRVPFTLFYTVGNYNIFNIPTFLQQVVDLNLIYDIESNVSFTNFVQYPSKYSIQNMSDGDKQKAVDLLAKVKTHKREINNLISYLLGKNSHI